jgi:hypothetical protein
MHARPLKPHMIQPLVSLSISLMSMAPALGAGFSVSAPEGFDK